jgi:hypothetical protein
MTDEQIKHMVDRFLMWKLPADFTPDNGITFDAVAGRDGPSPFTREPQGTNLLDATQARAMVLHMLDGLPSEDIGRPVKPHGSGPTRMIGGGFSE